MGILRTEGQAGAVANAIPGIIIQIVFIPVLVMVLEGFIKKQFKK